MKIEYEDSDKYKWEIEKESIPTLKELMEQLEDSDIPDQSWYVIYLTDLHKKQDSRGWIPAVELKALIKQNKDYRDLKMKLFWETYKDQLNSEADEK